MQLKEMQVKPTGKQMLFITGASANHYLESQAMLKNFHEVVLPNMKNYSLIYYDLGLTLEQRAQVQKHCKCEVRVFPVTKLEDWMKKLKCYAWKPLIVQANIRSADMLVWLDASSRLTMKGLKETLEDVKSQGMVLRPGGKVAMSQHIDKQMMQYFNSTACAYSPYRMTSGSFVFLHNEQFVRDAIVTPWAMCAVTQNCICPQHAVLYCNPNIHRNGKCHRYDQAGLTMIVTKLFGQYIESFRLNKLSYKVKRGDKYKYFDYLESQEKLGVN
ncbi:uncharacterized protein LOC124269174 [Haliotis rubra]|uniref:uncharacterized protein LOC124269174 n=1 Tax=Haliotis rubra TaxID=36100 RepID=UPI001EE63136|nr:uncharacterized protein LOC124269174 [Haliotis rubra]